METGFSLAEIEKRAIEKYGNASKVIGIMYANYNSKKTVREMIASCARGWDIQTEGQLGIFWCGYAPNLLVGQPHEKDIQLVNLNPNFPANEHPTYSFIKEQKELEEHFDKMANDQHIYFNGYEFEQAKKELREKLGIKRVNTMTLVLARYESKKLYFDPRETVVVGLCNSVTNTDKAGNDPIATIDEIVSEMNYLCEKSGNFTFIKNEVQKVLGNRNMVYVKDILAILTGVKSLLK